MALGHPDYSKVLTNEDIEIDSVRVVGRQGDRVQLQCLTADKLKLPTYGIGCGSSCIVLDAEEAKDGILLYHANSMHVTGQWYSVGAFYNL